MNRRVLLHCFLRWCRIARGSLNKMDGTNRAGFGCAEKPIETGVYPDLRRQRIFTGARAPVLSRDAANGYSDASARVVYWAGGSQHEPLEKHQHSEIWLVREGKWS